MQALQQLGRVQKNMQPSHLQQQQYVQKTAAEVHAAMALFVQQPAAYHPGSFVAADPLPAEAAGL